MHIEILSVEGDVYSAKLSGPVSDTDGRTKTLEHDGVDVYTKTVLLDLSEANYINSSGIGWMVSCHKRAVEHGGKIIFHSPQPLVDQTLKMMRIDKALHLVENLDAARNMASGA